MINLALKLMSKQDQALQINSVKFFFNVTEQQQILQDVIQNEELEYLIGNF